MLLSIAYIGVRCVPATNRTIYVAVTAGARLCTQGFQALFHRNHNHADGSVGRRCWLSYSRSNQGQPGMISRSAMSLKQAEKTEKKSTAFSRPREERHT
jgi:hypothetical protein